MTKKAKKSKKIIKIDSPEKKPHDSNFNIDYYILQSKLNNINVGVNQLETNYLTVKLRLSLKLFSQTEIDVSSFLNIEYLEDKISENLKVLSTTIQETTQPINMFSGEIDPVIIESVAKNAIVLFQKQQKFRNFELRQSTINIANQDSSQLKHSVEFSILRNLSGKTPIPFLKTIIDTNFSQSLINWQQFVYLFSQKEIKLIESDKDESEKYFIDKVSNNNFSNLDEDINHVWVFNKNIWNSAKNYLENGTLPSNDVKISFPFFLKYSNN